MMDKLCMTLPDCVTKAPAGAQARLFYLFRRIASRVILFFCFCLCLATLPVRAQDTEFWFAAPHMSTFVHGGTPLNYPAFLAISNGTNQTAHVEITLYNGGNMKTYSATILPSNLHKQDFNNGTVIREIENPRGSAGSVVKYGTHIRSDVKVTAYYMMDCPASRDIYTLKGHQALGTRFYVPMQSDNAAQTGFPEAFDQIDIVSTEDDTEVTVIPKAPIVNTGDTPNPFLAGDTLRRTLNRGETLKIMEQTVNSGSLAGTSITSDKPIAVTVTEDLVAGDTSGDQIVPVSSLGTRYIVPRGYLDGHARLPVLQERFYLVATAADTEVRIYTAPGTSSPTATLTLANAGDITRYNFPANVNVVYMEASAPVYVYQRSGYGEEGAVLLPSVFAIGQKQISFYQIGGVPVQKGFLVFKTGAHGSFTVSYGSGAPSTLSVTPLDVPNMPDWKVARFDYSSPPSGGRVVTIRNAQSPFSLGYITGDVPNNDSYGYLSAYSFELPDTTYMCTVNPSVTLEGGYAMTYEWIFNGSVISTERTVTVTQEGEYTLVMNQDPTIVTLTTVVRMINAGTISPDTMTCVGEPSPELTVSGASGDIFQWQSSPDNVTWTNIVGATSPTYSPGILTANTYFRRGITSGDCETLYTASTLVAVNPIVTADPIPDKEYHLNTTVKIPFTSPAGSNVTYKWANDNTHIGLPSSGEGDINFTAAGIGRSTITVTPYYNNCPGTSTDFVLTIYYLVPVNPHLRSRVVGN